jgi:hypothetical protein
MEHNCAASKVSQLDTLIALLELQTIWVSNQSNPPRYAAVSTATTATYHITIARVIILPSTLRYLACIARGLAGASQLHSNDEDSNKVAKKAAL